MNRICTILLLWFTLTASLTAQVTANDFEFDDLGPYCVHQADSAIPWGAVNTVVPQIFQGVAISGFVSYRIYWPDGVDPSQVTPDLFDNEHAPLVILNHGWAANPGDYDGIASHLTSWGFVVATVHYNVFPIEFQRPIEQAYESWLLKQYLLSEAANPTSLHPVRGVLSPDQTQKVGVVGHSMGGVASFIMSGADDSIDTMVALQPFEQSEIVAFGACNPVGLFTGSAVADQFVEEYEGSVYMLHGNDDQLVNNSVDIWFNKFVQGTVSPRRLVQMDVDGIGHFGCTDVALSPIPFYPCGITDLGDMKLTDQHLVQRRFTTMCLLSEFQGAEFENNFVDLFGDGFRDEQFDSIVAGGVVSVGFEIKSCCTDSIIWAKEVETPYNVVCQTLGPPTRPNSIAFGVLGLPGDLDATYLLVDLSQVGGVCPSGTFQFANSCVFTMYNNVAIPLGSLNGNGVRECNFGIVAGGFSVEMVSYLWRNGPFDFTRIAGFNVAP
ncbi:MAG: dienelactone hydrolase [Planctomycetota bacterium]|jgi:dienelactone hydrolase